MTERSESYAPDCDNTQVKYKRKGQTCRQVESRLMEHLWYLEFRSRMGSKNAAYVSVLEWGTWSWYGAAGSGLQLTCSGFYVDETVHDFVHHADLV